MFILLSNHQFLRRSSGIGNLGSNAMNPIKSLTETPDKKTYQGVREHAQPPYITHLTSLTPCLFPSHLQACLVEEGVIWLW